MPKCEDRPTVLIKRTHSYSLSCPTTKSCRTDKGWAFIYKASMPTPSGEGKMTYRDYSLGSVGISVSKELYEHSGIWT